MHRNVATFKHVSEPLRYFQGADSLSRLGGELDRVGSRRTAVVCAGSVARTPGLVDRVSAGIGARLAGVISEVKAHSPVPLVEAAARALAEMDADAVVAVGGGSAIVSARAAAILLAEGKPVEALCTHKSETGAIVSPRLGAPKLPQFVVPTTPTSAIVKAGSAVFQPRTGRRCALYDPKTRARAIFVDPIFLASAPQGLVQSAALDTMVLAVEAFIANGVDPLSDGLLLHTIRLTQSCFAAAPDPADLEVRARLVSAAVLCGRGTDNTSAGVATALGHAISTFCDSDNGLVKFVLLPHVLAFNAEAAGDRLVELAFVMTGHAGSVGALDAVLEALDALVGRLGLPRRLRDLGVPQEILPDAARSAMDDWWIRGNPRPVTGAAELGDLMARAW